VPRPYRWLDWLDTAVQAAQRPAIPNPRTAPKKNRSSSHAA
jgi:hypothetical protein